MVAPLMAAAGRLAVGGARAKMTGTAMSSSTLRGAGSKMMGSSNSFMRSTGGSMMSTGKVPENIQKMANSSMIMVKSLGTAAKQLVKISGKMAEASPLYKQQLTIMKKSQLLFLRPIADLLGKWLRPMAIWTIKFAMKWYEKFGGGGSADENPEDKKKQLEHELESAQMQGDDKRVAQLEGQIIDLDEELQPWYIKAGESIMGFGQSIGDMATRLWDEYIVNGWASFSESIASAWETYFMPGFEDISTMLSAAYADFIAPAWEFLSTDVNEIYPKYIEPAIKSLTEGIAAIYTTYLAPAWEQATTWVTDIWDTYLAPAFTPMKNWASDIYNDYIKAGFSSAKNWGSKIWSLIKSKFGFGSSGNREKAVGGTIPETGNYTLHAGERVVTAADVSRNNSSSKNMTVNNVFNIQASISNDMDIRTLASKLAELNETELRRRVSYM